MIMMKNEELFKYGFLMDEINHLKSLTNKINKEIIDRNQDYSETNLSIEITKKE